MSKGWRAYEDDYRRHQRMDPIYSPEKPFIMGGTMSMSTTAAGAPVASVQTP
jgi:hypothetical protein